MTVQELMAKLVAFHPDLPVRLAPHWDSPTEAIIMADQRVYDGNVFHSHQETFVLICCDYED